MRYNNSESANCVGRRPGRYNLKKAAGRMTEVAVVALLCLPWSFHLTAAEEASPATYDTLLAEALEQRNGGNFEAAESALRRARELALVTSEVDYLLGLVLAFQERFDDSLQVLNAALDTYPDDIQLQLAKARVMSYQGLYDRSLTMIESVLADQPDNREALVLAARVNLYARNLERSKILFTQVVEADPDNTEALLGLYDVEVALGNRDNADSLLTRAETLSPDNPDVVSRRESPSGITPRRHEINSAFLISDFDTAGMQRWYDRSLEYRFRSESGSQFFLRSEQMRRFGDQDLLTELGGVLFWGDSNPFELAIAYGDDADFSPQKRIRLATSVPLIENRSGWGTSLLDLAASHAEYQTGTVQSMRLGVTHYFQGFNGWLNSGVLLIEDERQNRSRGWTTGLHWQTTAKVRLGYTYTDAPETENNITTDTRAHHVYASYQLTERMALRLDGSHNARQNSFTREALGISLRFQF